jgi:CPA1 family monovalent cation:H+ antiporter
LAARVTDTVGRSALTLELPFAVYVAAEQVHASGVIAVVVLALEMRSVAAPDESAERLVQRSFWSVVELLVTGIAFGLIGLQLRGVVVAAGSELGRMLLHALAVVGVVFAVRAVWMVGALVSVRTRLDDATAAPRTGREAVVLAWCGMRGLATLALALALPATTDAGADFPARAELVLIATSVLVVTLVVPGFTLPFLVRRLGVAADADAEHAVEQAIATRARAAALATLKADDRVAALPEEVGANLRQRMGRLDGLLRGEPASAEDREQMEKVRRYRKISSVAQAEALTAARAEVLAARRERGVDPEAADRVLRRLDLRTVLLD